MEKLFEELLILINEVSDELVNRVHDKRKKNWRNAFNIAGYFDSDEYKNLINDARIRGLKDEAKRMEKNQYETREDASKACGKLYSNEYLMNQRKERKAKNTSNECLEALIDLLEEYINELDDETVKNSSQKRAYNATKAIDNYLEAVRKNNGNYEADEVQKAREEGRIAREKYEKNQELIGKRQKRLEKKFNEFKKGLLNRKPQTSAETQKAGSEHDNAMIDQHNRNELEKSFTISSESFDEIYRLIEAFINELDDETVKRAGEIRQADYEKAVKAVNSPEWQQKAYKAVQDGDMEAAKKVGKEREELEADRDKKGKKLSNYKDLASKRSLRKFSQKAAVERFRDKLLNKPPQTAKEYKQAAQDHGNAIIDQYLRNKLEKSLSVSNECFEEIMVMIKGFING